MENAAFSWRR